MTIDEFARSIENDMEEWIRNSRRLRHRKGSTTVDAGLLKARSQIIIRKLQAIKKMPLCNGYGENTTTDWHGNDLAV